MCHNLVDPGPPDDDLELEKPTEPRRRVLTKVPLEEVEMRSVGLAEGELHEYTRAKAQLLLNDDGESMGHDRGSIRYRGTLRVLVNYIPAAFRRCRYIALGAYGTCIIQYPMKTDRLSQCH